MDVLLIFAAMVMVYLYVMIFYFYGRSKEKRKIKSDLMIRAITHFRGKNWDQAQYYFEKVYIEAYELNDLHSAAESLYYLAEVSKEQEDYPVALEYLEEALEYYRNLKDEEGIHKTRILMRKINNKLYLLK